MAVCPLARRAGVRAGMTLAEARAACPGLADAGRDAARDGRALEAVGRWLAGAFSPVAAAEPPESILLDVGGSARLFGGLEPLRRAAAEALRRAGLTACCAVAPTPCAAWALASAGRGEVVGVESVRAALAPLPVGCLRLDPAAVDALAAVGVRTVGHLLALPRGATAARFGEGPLLGLDRALGDAPEPLACLDRRVPVRAALEFDAPVASLAGLWSCLKHLVGEVVTDLARRGAGARRLGLTLRPRWGEAESVAVRLAGPTRNAVRLFELLRTAAEPTLGRVKGHDGYVGFSLDVPSLERVRPGQGGLFGGADDAGRAAELGGLVERLVARLGEPGVGRAELFESHLPEWGWRRAGVGLMTEGRSVAKPRAAQAAKAAVAAEELIERHASARPRPMRLLDPPAAVGVVALGDGPPASLAWGGPAVPLTGALGPERVAGVWWAGRRPTRDYYDALDESGRRYWLFRVDDPRGGARRWFLHGVFD